MTISEAIKMLDVLYVLDAPNLAQAINMAKDALREKQEREENPQGKWISVKDGLPEAHRHVLVITNGRPNKNIELIQSVEIAEYESGAWFFEAWPGWMNTNVTHWMLLPEVPGMEETDEKTDL